MSGMLHKTGTEWSMDGEYCLNRIHLMQTEERHTHRFIELVYTYRGKGLHRINDREYPVGHGDLLLIDYHCEHTVEPIEDLRYVDLMMKPEYFSENLRGTEDAFLLLKLRDFSEFEDIVLRENVLLHFDGDERKKVETLIEWMEEEQKRKSVGGELILHAGLALLFSMIFRKMAEERKQSFAVDGELLAYIDRNCAQPLRLDELAKKCHYTPSHFSRTFKKHTGMSPQAYLLTCRIKRARQLLESTDLSVEQISTECGFTNRTVFFKHFSQSVGCTPMQYRRHQK